MFKHFLSPQQDGAAESGIEEVREDYIAKSGIGKDAARGDVAESNAGDIFNQSMHTVIMSWA